MPIKSQVQHSDWLPMIGQLSAGCVDHSCDLVSYYEFQVLSSKLIADEDSVLDLDDSDDVSLVNLVFKVLLLHRWLLLLELMRHLLL